MTIKGRKLALLLLLVVVLEILLFTASDADPFFWRRRRRRRSRRYVPRCSSSRPYAPRWVNSWQQYYFSFKCPTGRVLKKWQSLYRSCKGDRLYHFKCKNSRFALRRCSTFSYVNAYCGRLAFKCPHNQVITKVASIFNFRYKDRRFSFTCCGGRRVLTSNCKYTGIQNGWHGRLKYTAPRGYYFAGAFGTYKRIKKDRVWRFKICKLKKLVCRSTYG